MNRKVLGDYKRPYSTQIAPPSPSEEGGRKNRFALKPVNNTEGACGAFGAAGASADVRETFLGVCSFLAPSVVVAWAERGTLDCFEVSVNVLRCVFFERTTMRSQWGSALSQEKSVLESACFFTSFFVS